MKQNEITRTPVTEEQLSTARIMWFANQKNMVTAVEYIDLLAASEMYKEADETLLKVVRDFKGKKAIADIALTVLEQYFKHAGTETKEEVVDNFLATHKQGYEKIFKAGLFSKECSEYVISRVN